LVLRLRARQFNRLNGPGYCHFPIAYQQEFFNQLTSEEVRTRFIRGHPRALLVQAIGQEKRGARPPRIRACRPARAPSPLGSSPPRRPDRTAAVAAINPSGRRPASVASLIVAARAGEPLRAPTDPL